MFRPSYTNCNFADDPTPTPVNVSDVSSWFTYDSAEVNIVNGEFENVYISNGFVDDSLKLTYFHEIRIPSMLFGHL